MILALKRIGRWGSQERLRELLHDLKLGRAERGWIRQDINHIKRGGRGKDRLMNIRRPPEMDLAHAWGFESAKGFSYLLSYLQARSLHKIQHLKDYNGRRNKTPKSVKNFITENSINVNTKKGQRQIQEFYQQMVNGSSTSSSFRFEKEKHSRQFQKDHSIKYSQYMGYVKPGGIELCRSLQFSSCFSSIRQPLVKFVNIEPRTRSVLVQTSEGNCRYIPNDLTVEELLCLRTAVKETTKKGIMFSLEREYHVLDGVVSTMEGAKQIETTLTEADYLLCHPRGK